MDRFNAFLIDLFSTIAFMIISFFLLKFFKFDFLTGDEWYTRIIALGYYVIGFILSTLIYVSIIYLFVGDTIGKRIMKYEIYSVFGHMTIFRFYIREYFFKIIYLGFILWNLIVIQNNYLTVILILVYLVLLSIGSLVFLKKGTFILDNLLFTKVKKRT